MAIGGAESQPDKKMHPSELMNVTNNTKLGVDNPELRSSPPPVCLSNPGSVLHNKKSNVPVTVIPTTHILGKCQGWFRRVD